MPVKRPRNGRSSSFGEPDLLNHISPPVEPADRLWEMRTAPPSAATVSPNNPTKFQKLSVADNTDQSPTKILTLSSPALERVDVSDKQPVGGFLEKCYYCKKKIHETDEVFMYSYLRAFCSAECRDTHIAMDNEVEKQSENLKGMMAQCKKNMKDNLGFYVEQHADPKSHT